MFETSYPYYSLGYTKSLKPYIKGIKKFGFKSDHHRYIVELEHYENEFYVVQYFCAEHKSHPKRFQIMTNEHRCRKIIGTCVKIMYDIWDVDKKCSFGFIGANTYDPNTKKEEPVDNTKRWRIYKHAMENNFGTETFTHGNQEKNSTYVMLNKRANVDELNDKINDMFAELYHK